MKVVVTMKGKNKAGWSNVVMATGYKQTQATTNNGNCMQTVAPRSSTTTLAVSLRLAR